MPKTRTSNYTVFKEHLKDVEALKACLDYLEVEAVRAGMLFSAHLIGVAAASVLESISTCTAMEERCNAESKMNEAPAENPNGKNLQQAKQSSAIIIKNRQALR